MKRKSPPRTPSKAHSLVPFSGTHWGTVLVSAPVTQHFPHSTFSLPIAFAFPFCLQLSFAWGKWAVASQALKKNIYFHPPCRWCITNLLYLYLRQGMPLSVHLDLNSGFYIWYEHKIILTLTLKNKPPWCFFFPLSSVHLKPLCCLHKRPKCCGQTAAAAIDFESRRCDASKKKQTVWSSWTWHSPSGKSTPFSRLTINKPLPSFLLSHSPSPVWELCTSVRKSSFHSLVQQDTTQPDSPGREGKCFISVENCLLLCHLNTNSIF